MITCWRDRCWLGDGEVNIRNANIRLVVAEKCEPSPLRCFLSNDDFIDAVEQRIGRDLFDNINDMAAHFQQKLFTALQVPKEYLMGRSNPPCVEPLPPLLYGSIKSS